MSSSTRAVLLFALQLAAGASLSACEHDDDATPALTMVDAAVDEEPATRGALAFSRERLYSAFVEGHPAQIPLIIADHGMRGKGARFFSSDLSIAVVEDTLEGAMISVKKEGNVVIKGVLRGLTGSIKLTIDKYTEAQWLVGRARYTNNVPALVSLDGGALNPLTLTDPRARNPEGACLTCHSPEATKFYIEDTPAQTAGYSEDELIALFTRGQRPEGSVRLQSPDELWGSNHSWNVADEQKRGLVAYLRTKPPKPRFDIIGIGVRPCSEYPAPPGSSLCENPGNPGEDGGLDAAAPSAFTDAVAPSPLTDAGATPRSDAGQ